VSPAEARTGGQTRDPVRALWVCNLGLVEFDEALVLQRAVARARIAGDIPEDVLLLCEHPPVVTLGRGFKPAHLLVDEAALGARGIALREAERGGDVTLHAPGQLVGYPVMDLKRHRQDLHWYLRQVEECLIRAMAAIGITAAREDKRTGVWTHGRKLASIGVHARDWVTWHGFALNVTTDLALFDVMVPCGLDGVTMTSVQRELGPTSPNFEAVSAQVTAAFGDVFGLVPLAVVREQLT
jgi:lipoate-protein ligase B